jgi:hypothetical protein
VREQKMKKQFFFRQLTGKFGLISIFVFCLFTIAEAHTFHTTLTRIDYNEKEKLAEISIQMFTHDLVPTLEAITKKQVNLEKTKDVDKLIFDYLQKQFILKDKNGEVKKLVWVGFELEVDTVFVYLEAEISEGLENAQLQNSMFFEYFQEQSNLVICKFGNKKADLAFKVGDKFFEISGITK